MEEQTGYMACGSGQLYYRKWGNGKQLLLAFHGYGDTGAIFLPIAEYLQGRYTVIAVDLPHHGGSNWQRGALLAEKDLIHAITTFVNDYGAKKISLMGYSLGGRVCLDIMACLPELIERIVLIAPDGLRKDPYYNFFTRTWLGKKVFRNMLEHPTPFMRVMRMVKDAKLVHEKRYIFAMHFLHSEESRDLLLQVWPAMSGLMPAPAMLKKIIGSHHLAVIIFMGAADKIMPPWIGKKFIDGLGSAKLFILEKGHRMVDEETAGQIAQSLL